MESIEYIGEHGWAGIVGNALISLAFVTAIFCAFTFYMAERQKSTQWSLMGRNAFRLHTLAIICIMGVLFIMLFNKWYEYDYVWKHRNNAMQLRYIFSCFWEGFEGAFILWGLWHAVLGNFIMSRAKQWREPVLTVISIANFFIISMVLGIHVFDFKIGNSPFMLIRELADNVDAPWSAYPDYLSRFPQFSDGRGLNPLLQNYWMVIHPPTVFLGFASTIVPAAFAIAGLWRRKYHEWIEPALPWTYLGIMILGTGILMGGVWAYEALSFGGFWAWDPVENASLVPWITLVAAGHVMLINRKKGDSTYTSLLLAMVSFIFVIYSNFLTNSGVLGETSVHAFTDNGLTGQLAAYLCFFIALPVAMFIHAKRLKLFYLGALIILLAFGVLANDFVSSTNLFLFISVLMLIIDYRNFPRKDQDEHLWSREFWMFIGSLVLVMSALQISFMTSKPVFNLLAEPGRDLFMWMHEKTNLGFLESLASGTLTEKTRDEVIADYNKWQTPFAFIIAFFVAIGQFLKYKKTDMKKFMKEIALTTILSVLFTVGTVLLFGFKNWTAPNIALLFTSALCVFANLDFMIRVMKGNIKKAGASIAHIGFGLILLGALVSTSQSKEVSQNTTMFDITQLGETFSNSEDILLFAQDTIMMDEYFVSYQGKKKVGINVYYTMDYFAQVPKKYRKGDRVYAAGLVHEAAVDHLAGKSFLEDKDKWNKLPIETPIEKRVRLWTNLESGELLYSLYPKIQLNPVFDNVAEPDTKHFLDEDIYTHIRYAEVEEEENAVDAEGYRPAKTHKISLGDTITSGGKFIILDTLRRVIQPSRYGLGENDIAIKAEMRVIADMDTTYQVNPIWVLDESSFLNPIEDVVEELNLRVKFTEIFPQEAKMSFEVAEHKDNVRDFVVMQAIVFPWINILWIGIIIMGLGTLIAVLERFRRLKRK